MRMNEKLLYIRNKDSQGIIDAKGMENNYNVYSTTDYFDFDFFALSKNRNLIIEKRKAGIIGSENYSFVKIANFSMVLC